jgi:signal transduction histidine kinase
MKILDDAGSELGLLVVNYNLNYLFARLRAMQTATNTFEMIDSEGFWLLSQTPEIEWLHLYGDILSSFANQFPNSWPNIKQSRTLQGIELAGGRPLTVLPSFVDDRQGGVPSYFFLSKARANVWQQRAQLAMLSVISTSLIVYGLLVAIMLLWWKNAEQKRAYMQALQHEKQQLEIAQSELQNNNRDLVTLQNELVEKGKLSSLGLMVAGVGHELNTPLGGVRLSLSSLEHLIKQIQSELSEQQATLFQNSLNLATQNLNRAVQVVAQFKRMTENQMSPDSECFSVNAMFDDTLAPLKAVLKKHPNVRVERHCDPADEIIAAQGVISQVLQNLIMNALDHAFDNEQSGVITLTAICESEYVIEVSDNGKGIRKDIIDHVWEPFVTTERGIKQHSGLGLFMVHQWVTRLLKGRVTVHSEPGQTRFTLYLPIPESNEP